MEETSSQPKNNPVILTLIIVALVIGLLNLLLTTTLLVRSFSHPDTMSSDNSTPLPKELSSAKRSEIFEQLKRLYNAQDTDGLYKFLSRDAQLQVTKQSIVDNVKKLQSAFGNIADGAYSYHRSVKGPGGKDFIVLTYSVKFSEPSSFSPKGLCQITVSVSEGQVDIYGFFISSNEGTKN